MKRPAFVDKAIMYAVIGGLCVLCIIEVLALVPDEIRYRARRREGGRKR
jgi:hypothetical protein